MEALNNNWITEKHTDFEHKTYILLGFLQKIDQEFESQRLYPALEFLERTLDHLIQLKEAILLLEKNLSKNVKHIDIQNYKLVYQSVYEDDKMMQDIAAILDFSIPKVERLLQKGRRLIQQIDQNISISPVGLTPLSRKEGYLFLNTENEPKTMVFSYKVSFYESVHVAFSSIRTQFLNDYAISITSTYEGIKHELIKINKDLPNPATFLVATALPMPIDDTLLPLAKLKLSKFLH